MDLSHSEVSQCYLSMRCIDFTKEKVLRLRLVYKWGSEAVALDSNDFVTVSDCSAGGACLPEVKSFGGKFDSLFIVVSVYPTLKFNKSFVLLRPTVNF